MDKSVYGINDDDKTIKPPKPSRFPLPLPGRENDVWEIIEEGGEIPQIHREYIVTWWCQERRCHSTMTAMKARFVVILLTLLIGILYYADKKACNKTGLVAEKINWAGHNCPR